MEEGEGLDLEMQREVFATLNSPGPILNPSRFISRHHNLRVKRLRLQNNHILQRAITLARLDRPNPIHNIHPIHNLPENRMLPIQMGRRGQTDKELAPIRARPAIGHTQHALAVMPQGADDFVLEFAAVDGGAAGAGAGGVAALEHL